MTWKVRKEGVWDSVAGVRVWPFHFNIFNLYVRVCVCVFVLQGHVDIFVFRSCFFVNI